METIGCQLTYLHELQSMKPGNLEKGFKRLGRGNLRTQSPGLDWLCPRPLSKENSPGRYPERDWAIHVSNPANFVNLIDLNHLHELQKSLQLYTFHKLHYRDFHNDDASSLRKSRVTEPKFSGQERYQPPPCKTFCGRKNDECMNKW